MRERIGIAIILCAIAIATAAQTSLTVPVPTGATSVTVTIPAPIETQGAPSLAFVTPTPAQPPTPSPSAATVYNNGTLVWPGDYSYAATINYKDVTCAESGGTAGLHVSTVPWGAWQPYGPNWNYDLTPYGKGGFLLIDLKPNVATQIWSIFALKVGDLPITGPARLVNSYGPTPIVGQWATYKIPLSAFMTDNGVQLTAMYKFDIQDKTGLASNGWCVNNVHFSAT